MSRLKVIFCCVCLVGLTQLVWSQNSNLSTAPGSREHGIPGYLDPRTGTFTAKVPTRASVSPDTTVTYSVLTGTWDFTIPITLKTTPANGDILACEIDLSVNDPVTYTYIETGIATQTASGASSCTVSIPYTWVLTAPTTDVVVISYDISIIHGYSVGPATGAKASRNTSRFYTYSEPVPANGVTTSITINHIEL